MARGRRRRVLNEELLSGATLSLTAADRDDQTTGEAPRYGEMACIEHHPQVSDFVPRRKRAAAFAVLAGWGVAAAAELLAHYAERIAGAMPAVASAAAVRQIAAGGAAWASGVYLLAAALLARLIFSLRRHRVDDYEGSYRVWRLIAWLCVLASANSVIRLQQPVAQALKSATGWSLTAGGAEWWLAPVAALGAWVFWRLAADAAESHGALAAITLAGACYATAATSALGWAPPLPGIHADQLARGMAFAGHAALVASLLIFARYVVLDVQGLIDHAPRPVKSKKPTAVSPDLPAEPPAPIVKIAAASAPPAEAPSAVPADDWDDDDDRSHDSRKLSKAERKKLRRQNRAA